MGGLLVAHLGRRVAAQKENTMVGCHRKKTLLFGGELVTFFYVFVYDLIYYYDNFEIYLYFFI